MDGLTQVPSTDGVDLAVHDLGGSGAPLLVSHATGFHGRCYAPMAAALPSRHSIAFDYRGHGDTLRATGGRDWQQYGDDAEAMAAWLAQRVGGPIDAFGHSMGAACLLIAAHRRPELFRRIVAFEPIVFPPYARDADPKDSPLAQGALRRRAVLPSYEAAIANYAGKPPLNGFDPAALEAYVRHGFRQDADGQVHLKCTPLTESETFAGGPTHDTWDHLPSIRTEVVIITGRVEEFQPSGVAKGIAERLPHGRYVERDDLDHFGPMTHPAEMAALLAQHLSSDPA